jgi:glucose/mannose-6-phosphate isomerase
MLDDLKLIHEKDADDALGIAGRQWQQLQYDFTLQDNHVFGKIDNVVYTGMGGSALAALIAQSWPTLNKPFEVIRNYTLPAYVGPNTLVIAASYSGNTEETLSALEDATAKGAQIAVITAGGKLEEIASQKGYLFAKVPKAEQPRYAVLYNLRALLQILVQANLLPETILQEMQDAAKPLEEASAAWPADIPTAQNPAKQLANELVGKSIVVYGGPEMYPAAYKWKISFNENAKQIAWVNQLPEFNHNEFIGWSKQPVDKPYAVIDLRSNLEHPRVQKRFEVTARLLSGMRPAPHVVQAQGDTLLAQLLYTITFGDLVSIYLAILNGLNPAPVDLVEKFKKELTA